MKRTQALDACRNIQKEIVSFFSIMMIGMLASMAFLSVIYSAATLKKDALSFFNSNELWDLEISSTLLLDEEDLEAIRKLPRVREAEPVYQVEAGLRIGSERVNVSVISLPEKISRPVLLEGRFPETAEECAMEKQLMDEQGFSLGQQIQVEAGTISGIDPLISKNYRITGAFQTPDHITNMIPITPYIFVCEDCFDREGLDGAFMKVRVLLEAPSDRYSDAYLETVQAEEEALKVLQETRSRAREDKLHDKYEEKLNEGQAQLDEGKEQLQIAQDKLDTGYQEIETASEQLNQMAAQLFGAPAMFNEARGKITAGVAQLEKARGLLEAIRPIIAKGENWILDHFDESQWPEDLDLTYAEFEQALRDGKVTMAWLYEVTGYNAGERLLKEAMERLESARRDWYFLGEEYLDGVTQLEDGIKQLDAGKQELDKNQEKLNEAERELQEKKKELTQIGKCRWIVLDNRSNPGYVYAEGNFNKLGSLSMAFSSIFLVVGALVIYATIGRMVEQQRKLVGATKAMGLYNREVFAKYLIFGCSSTLIGVGLGILISWLPLQRYMLGTYEKLFNYGVGTKSFLPRETGIVVAGAFGISVGAVFLGCSQLLRLPAIQLMQGLQPSSGRKKARRSGGKTLYSRLILLNMRTDWRRVMVTTTSIAGGCLLLVIGFTLRYGISGVTPKQFGQVMTYDAEIFYNAAENKEAVSEIEAVLKEDGLSYVNVRKETGVFDAEDTLGSLTMIIADRGMLKDYYKLCSIDDGGILDIPESGALVPRRFWEVYSINPGENVTVYDAEMNPRLLEVAGVFENYYGQLFFMTPQAYEEAFGSVPEANCLFVRTNGLELEQLQQEVAGIDGFVKLADAAAERKILDQFSVSLNFVVWIMLFLAGMMACFIVANFTLIYIQRKTRELTIMRINGFTTGECIRYIAIDLIVTTILGIALGLVLGGILGAQILRVTETPQIQMIREPVIQSFLFSALITSGFSVLTNGFALRKVAKLKLSDIS